jgi:hypothetical protein
MARFSKQNTHHSDNQSIGVQHPTLGDFALQGDTRHPLHHQPLPHRGGAHGRDVTMRGLGGRMTNPNVPHDLAVDGDAFDSSYDSYGS